MIPDIDSERRKYAAMWAHESYAARSPGLLAVDDFLHSCSPLPGDTLIDLGCGTGRAANAIYEKLNRKVHVCLFDLVNAVDSDISLKFIAGNLWDFDLSVFDWIYCTDVLEHIPPDHIDETLDGMSRITGKGGLLTIAHIPSKASDFGIGLLDGELHLTVKPPKWWRLKIDKRWKIRDWRNAAVPQSSLVILGPKK